MGALGGDLIGIDLIFVGALIGGNITIWAYYGGGGTSSETEESSVNIGVNSMIGYTLILLVWICTETGDDIGISRLDRILF